MELHKAESLGLLGVVVPGHVHILDASISLEHLTNVLRCSAVAQVSDEKRASTVSSAGRHGVGRVFPVLCVDTCLLYTSDAADEEDSVDLGGRRIIKKKKMLRLWSI
eukprot:TRINITY_DN13291_c0_g1_i1.p4 TRINITY_DN13291_c0_g1~~TRINITY_DN13291_c0_g1_i1.p4  ORF type:complete len:107 (-),score=9.91 TRINITY_DN13291_c0_g1_i1:39-359(-)